MNYQQIGNILNSNKTRNKKIAAFIEFGYSSREIQQLMKCGPNAISNVRKSFNMASEPPEQAKIRRPTKRTPEVQSFIVKQTLSNPMISTIELSQQVQMSQNISIGHKFNFLPSIIEPNLTEIK